MSALQIPLTRGQVALVDEADHARLAQHKWHAWWSKHTRSFYAKRTIWVNGKFQTLSMHREILGLGRGDHRQGDHISCETLDNRRSNLRIVTHTQNARNSKIRATNKSGFKGVSRDGKAWRATISIDRKIRHLGCFSTPEAAHEAYKSAVAEHHGEFGRTA